MTQTVLCFGELLWRLSAPGHERLLQSPSLHACIGGAEANVAISLACLGHDSRLASVVPDNALGQAAVGELRRYGVDTRSVVTGGGRMGLYFYCTGALHRPSEVLYDRAGSAFATMSPQQLDWSALLDDVRLFHVSGITPAVGDGCARAALAAVTAARERGITVSFDGNFRARLWHGREDVAAAATRSLLAAADIAFVDPRDIALALGWQVPASDGVTQFHAACERAFDAFPQLQRMACTLRNERSVDHHHLGALLGRRDGAPIHLHGYELSPIVDRIGGGDAFAAGVLHGILSGLDDEATLRFGLGAACLKHSLPGDANTLDVASIRQFVEEGRLHVRR